MELNFNKMNKIQVVLIVTLLLIVQSSIMTVSCRPSDNHKHHRHQQPAAAVPADEDSSSEYNDLTAQEFAGIRKCQDNEDLMELCMRCAKATKATNVYPMCCLNTDAVGDWCKEFVYFGIQ